MREEALWELAATAASSTYRRVQLDRAWSPWSVCPGDGGGARKVNWSTMYCTVKPYESILIAKRVALLYLYSDVLSFFPAFYLRAPGSRQDREYRGGAGRAGAGMLYPTSRHSWLNSLIVVVVGPVAVAVFVVCQIIN